MKIETTRKVIVKSICGLDESYLNQLDDDIIYSYDYKDELIQKFRANFKELKSNGITSLKVVESKCEFCYPDKKTYAFYNPTTNELVLRYVIFQESQDFYRVEECKNQLTNKRHYGLPF